MNLIPLLPMLDGESTMSWVSRLARFHSGMASFHWLETLEISRQDVITCTAYCIERLSNLTGVHPERIRDGAILQLGDRSFRHRAQHFGPNFTTRARTTYCPACLLEDCNRDSPSNGMRVGRANWQFTPVRACRKHAVELVRTKNCHFKEQFQDMALVAPDDCELARQAEGAQPIMVSSLQAYIEDRFAGSAGPAWLDGQRIDQAAKTCEILGACVEYGAHHNFKELTAEEWIRAGAVGFEVAAAGTDGIHDALAVIEQESRKTKAKRAPQAVFGRLYEWLQYNRCRTDRGPIREVLREYILGTMAIAPGTNLLGEVVERRRLHSVASLSLATGVNTKTLNRALVRAGHIPGGDESKVDEWVCVDEEAERFAIRIRDSLPIKKIPDYINCNRTQAYTLVRKGILPQLLPGKGEGSGILTGVAIEELDRFLLEFRKRGKPVSSATAGMANVIEASELAKQPVVDIVQLVLAGALDSIEILPAGGGFRSVLVDPDEVKDKAVLIGSEFGFSQDQVAARFGLNSSQVNQLRSAREADGRPVLKGRAVANARGTVRYRYHPDEIRRFAKYYGKLGQIAKEHGVSSRAMKRNLAERSIAPIIDPKRLKVEFYRRSEL